MIATDRDGRVTEWNPGAEHVLGWSSQDVRGDLIHRIFTPEDRAHGWPAREMRLALEAGRASDERWHMKRDGSRFWASGELMPLRAEDGEHFGFLKILRDRTEQRRVEDALRASEERACAAQRAGGIGTFEWHPDTRRVEVSTEYRRIWGIAPSIEVTDDLLLDMLRPDDRHLSGSARLGSGDNPLRYAEYRITRPDTGEERWIARWGEIVSDRDEHGTPRRRFVGVAFDVTERKRAEHDLREGETRLRALHAELLHVSRLSVAGELAAALAHELNQPLTAITSAVAGALRMLRTATAQSGTGAATVPARALEAMDRAAAQSLRAGQIVRRMRDFITKSEAEKRPEVLRGLLEEASTLALAGAGEPGVQITFRLSPDLPSVLVDRIQIQQVLINLIRNAIEAMAGEGAAADETPAARRELVVAAVSTGQGTAEVSVADTGPGLAPEIADGAFEAFISTKPGGMGIGLSICRSIVKAHGGRLWAEPNPGGGTVFRFTLVAWSSEKALATDAARSAGERGA